MELTTPNKLAAVGARPWPLLLGLHGATLLPSIVTMHVRLLKFALGLPQMGELVRLKASALNSSRILSVIGKLQQLSVPAADPFGQVPL